MKKALKIAIIVLVCIVAVLAALAVIRHTGNRITPFQAVDIAMKNAGLTEEQVVEKDADLEEGLFSMYYEVELDDGTTEYIYSIDAGTGEIISFYHKPSD